MIDLKLTGKVVLITGANYGIGQATAQAFAAQGARVLIHFLDAAPVEQYENGYRPLHVVKGKAAAQVLVRRIQEQGGQAFAIPADLADPAAVPALFDQAERACGPVDVLVNNAVHCEDPDTIYATSTASLERYFAVNTRAVVMLIHEFVRRFQARRASYGRIINLSTDAAQCFAGQIIYGATKAMIEALTRSIACEAGPLGITVNTIAPGPIQTGWMTPEQVERLSHEIPLGRVGEPAEIADAIVFLASDQARWLTGQVIKVSGGHNL
jgi:3-oxoacyl-[acyl-carrier protein] reductase